MAVAVAESKIMNGIRQHIPNFIGGVEPEVVAFETLEELLAIPWVSTWTKLGRRRFHRWAKSEGCLMAEYSRGSYWLVIGYLKKPQKVDLPEADYGKILSRRRNKKSQRRK